MDRESLKNYAIKVIKEECPDPEKTVELFTLFFDNKIVDQQRLLKGCVNHFYDAKYKENECHSMNTLIDSAIEFDVSVRFVKNVIYKFRNVRLEF